MLKSKTAFEIRFVQTTTNTKKNTQIKKQI